MLLFSFFLLLTACVSRVYAGEQLVHLEEQKKLLCVECNDLIHQSLFVAECTHLYHYGCYERYRLTVQTVVLGESEFYLGNKRMSCIVCKRLLKAISYEKLLEIYHDLLWKCGEMASTIEDFKKRVEGSEPL